jgi:hypothetical protein
LLLLFLSLLEIISCTQGTLTRYSLENKIIAEGTVKYLEIGGTREISNHNGYYLSDPEWFVRPVDAKGVLYIFLNFDITSYINKRVHIEGSIRSVPGEKISSISYQNGYQEIIVDSIRVIN